MNSVSTFLPSIVIKEDGGMKNVVEKSLSIESKWANSWNMKKMTSTPLDPSNLSISLLLHLFTKALTLILISYFSLMESSY
jgi:hypothetical protein